MLEFLPEDVRNGLQAAQIKAARRSARLCVHVGEAVYPILRMWETGFAVDARRTPKLRGLIDVFDGPRHVSQALIIAADETAGEMIYEFKRETMIPSQPIRDFAEDKQRPDGYLSAPR